MALKKVTGIAMGVLSSQEIISLSEGELIELSESTEKNIDPIYHPLQGVFPDLHGEACQVCASKKQCTGHPMHIMLEYPVINPALIKEVLYTLSCICPRCQRSIYFERKCQTLNIQSTGVKRMKAIQKRLKKDTVCFHDDCQALLPQYEIRGEYIYYWYNESEFQTKENEENSPKKEPKGKKKPIVNKSKKSAIKMETKDIVNLFKKISQEEFDNLGFNSKLPKNPIYSDPDIQVRANQSHRLSFRPEDMIFTAFPIASKIITSQEDDTDDIIASKYRNIFKNNLKLRRHRLGKNKITDEKTLSDLQHKLTQEVCVVVDNTSTKAAQPHNHREMRTLAHYVKGKKNKTAIQRNNIQGKRIECNARTNIGPGPFQKAWEVAIPYQIADILMNEFPVGKYNIIRYQELIDNAKNNDEKIPYVVRKQKKIHIKFATKNYSEKFILEEGDIVGLKLESGNWGFFNRQPSLRATESFQGVQTKVLPKGTGKTFRLPLCAVTPYNADFDG